MSRVDCSFIQSCSDVLLYIIFYVLYSEKPCLTLLHSERPKLHTILAFLSAVGLKFALSIDAFRTFQYNDLLAW